MSKKVYVKVVGDTVKWSWTDSGYKELSTTLHSDNESEFTAELEKKGTDEVYIKSGQTWKTANGTTSPTIKDGTPWPVTLSKSNSTSNNPGTSGYVAVKGDSVGDPP